MLLDTNALSAWAKRDPIFLRTPPMDRLWYLSAITLGEYRFGLLKSSQRGRLERWLEDTEPLCIVLAPDAQTARHYARLRFTVTSVGRNPQYHDLWIAALAVQHGLPVVSLDTHFDSIPGIRRIGW